MKEFLDVLKSRYSVRNFTNQKVEEDKISKIIEAGRIAPTACNKQPQIIYSIESDEGLEKLQKCKHQHFNEQLAFLICYDSQKCWIRDFDNKKSGEVDASIVATHMMLEASSLGVGSTWIMHFIPDAIIKEFNLDENIIPVCLLVMGYETSDNKPAALHYNKKEIKEFVKRI